MNVEKLNFNLETFSRMLSKISNKHSREIVVWQVSSIASTGILFFSSTAVHAENFAFFGEWIEVLLVFFQYVLFFMIFIAVIRLPQLARTRAQLVAINLEITKLQSRLKFEPEEVASHVCREYFTLRKYVRSILIGNLPLKIQDYLWMQARYDAQRLLGTKGSVAVV